MKRIITVALIAVTGAVAVLAQEVQVKRPRLLIENFSCAGDLSTAYRDQVRMNVISAINATERFDVMDANTQDVLDREAARRASENAMYDELARTQNIIVKANNYILRGSLLSCSTQSTSVEGKTRYTYGLSYSITLVDASKSVDVATQTFSHGAMGTQSLIGGTGGAILNHLGTYASAADAINAGMGQVDNDIEKFLLEYLPLEGEVIAEDYEVKKDKLQAFYINIGSELGVKVGDHFAVMIAQVRAGRTIYQEIGRMKVKEVLDGTLSYCDVTKGEKAIYEAMEEYQTMVADDPATKPLFVKQVAAPGLTF
jgi:hypothetical protein